MMAGFLSVALGVFTATYPTHFLIADEVAYFEQALEWGKTSISNSQPSWIGRPQGSPLQPIVSDYPPGTALLAAGFISLFGPKAVFWSGFVAWLIGIWALTGLLHRLNKPVAWALYPALFLPGLVLTRTLMSDLPSFALSCIFLFLFTNQSTSQPVNQPTNQPINQSTRFVAGLVAGLSLLFRETNLLWALPFFVGAFWRARVNPTPNPSPEGEGGLSSNNPNYPGSEAHTSHPGIFQECMDVAPLPFGGGVGGGVDTRAAWKMLWLGFAIGLLPRLAWGWFAFGDPFFVRDSGIAFSWSFLPQNLGFYLLTLLVLAPGGLYFLVKNKSPYRWEISVAALLFLGVYGCYGYDAFAKSGYKALVLQGRFLMPLLPFVALAAAETMPRVGRNIQFGSGVLILALFIGVQMLGHAYNSEQQRITDALLQLPTRTHYTFTPDESSKYFNALHGNQALIVPTQHAKPNTQHCFAHLITRSDSADRIKKTAEAEVAFQQYFRGRETTLVTDLTIRDGTRLRVWRIQQTTRDEQTR